MRYNPGNLKGHEAEQSLRGFFAGADCHTALWTFSEDEGLLGAEVVASPHNAFLYAVSDRRALFGKVVRFQQKPRAEKVHRVALQDILHFDPHVSLKRFFKRHRGLAIVLGVTVLAGMLYGLLGGMFSFMFSRGSGAHGADAAFFYLFTGMYVGMGLAILMAVGTYLLMVVRLEFTLRLNGKEEIVYYQVDPLPNLALAKEKQQAFQNLCDLIIEAEKRVPPHSPPTFPESRPGP